MDFNRPHRPRIHHCATYTRKPSDSKNHEKGDRPQPGNHIAIPISMGKSFRCYWADYRPSSNHPTHILLQERFVEKTKRLIAPPNL